MDKMSDKNTHDIATLQRDFNRLEGKVDKGFDTMTQRFDAFMANFVTKAELALKEENANEKLREIRADLARKAEKSDVSLLQKILFGAIGLIITAVLLALLNVIKL